MLIYVVLASLSAIYQLVIVPRKYKGIHSSSEIAKSDHPKLYKATEYLGVCNRFTVSSHVLVFLSTFLIILPVVMMEPQASDLNDGIIERTFGNSNTNVGLVNPATDSLDFNEWMFLGLSANGPYAGTPDSALQTEFVYKTLPSATSPENSCERSYTQDLKLDVNFPQACMKLGNCPANTPLAPIIFHIHCGGWEQGDKSELCGGWANGAYFVDRGYAIVSVQYRLVCHGFNASDMLADLRDAYAYVQTNAPTWNLNHNSVHLFGASAGGHLALLFGYSSVDAVNSSGTNYQGIRSITNMYGVTDIDTLEVFGSKLCEIGKTNTYSKLVGGSCTSDNMRAASPIPYITSSSPPTFSFHGTIDGLIPWAQAELLKDKLDQNGVRNYLMTLYSWGHVPEHGYYGVPAQMFRYAFERVLAATS